MKKFSLAMLAWSGRVLTLALFGLMFASCGGGGSNNTPGGNNPGSAPNTPSGLTATATSSSQINLAWNAVPWADGYYLYTSLTPTGTYTLAETVNTTSTVAYNASPNTTYYFKVAAFNSYGTSPQSGYVSATTLPSGGNPDPGPGGGTAPTITTTTLPNGTVGTAYSQTLTATGDAPITWSVASGALPGGLSLSSAGVISGTPTTANTFSFTLRAANAAGSATKALSIVIGTSTYAIGARGPGGGIIFYVSASGFTVEGYGTAHYLEAAPADAGTAYWGPVEGGRIDGGAREIGQGRKNTALIIAALGSQGNFAAQLCVAYRGGGLSDWFLPSELELMQLWNQRNLSGINWNGEYWSSTGASGGRMAIRIQSSGSSGGASKDSVLNVRAIRAF